MKRLLLLLVAALFIGTSVGCGTVVPPGKKVILVNPSGDDKVVHQGVYHAWGRTKAYLVDQKLASFSESLNILCADDINMKVDLKILISFEVDDDSIEFIKAKVPAVKADGVDGELSLEQFYQMAVKDVCRGTARNSISVNETDDIRPKRTELEAEIQKIAKERVKALGYPVAISAILISNIDYPDSVTATREKIKQAELADQEKAALAEAALADAKRQVAVEQEKAKIKLVQAQAQADENKILTESLTKEFLMWRQFEVLELTAKNLAHGDSNTVFMMPYQTMSPDMLNTAVLRDGIKKSTEKE